MAKTRSLSLRGKLILIISTLFTATIAMLVGNAYLQEKKAIMASVEGQLLKDYQSVIELISLSAEKAYGLAETVATLPEVQKTFAAGERERLMALTAPLHGVGKARLNIHQFQFHLPPATSFLRLHEPTKFGDDLSATRPTIVKASGTQQPVLGLDTGPFGMGIRGVAPVSSDGRFIGVVEFGIAVNDRLLQPLHERYGINAAIAIDKGGKPALLAQSGGVDIAEPCRPLLAQVLADGTRRLCDVSTDDRHLLLLAGPLADFSGKTAGLVLVRMDYSHQVASLKRLLWLYVGVGLAMIVIVIAICAWFFNHYLIKRFRRITEVLQKASLGDLKGRVNIASRDEMGQLGDDIDQFLEDLSTMLTGMKERSQNLRERSATLREVSDKMLAKVESANRDGEEIDGETARVNDNLQITAAAVEETAANVGAIAAAAEEMSATIREIAGSMERALRVSGAAVSRSGEASAQISQLGQAAGEIGRVTEAIEEISEQTNLLALNATIEAARAGEAGKGFAVVANEIKELAKQTALATGDIKHKIDAIRTTTEQAVASIGSIATVIGEVNDNISSVAAAVEQQSKATDEISGGVGQASLGIREVTENVARNAASLTLIADRMAKLSRAIEELSADGHGVAGESQSGLAMAEEMRAALGKYSL